MKPTRCIFNPRIATRVDASHMHVFLRSEGVTWQASWSLFDRKVFVARRKKDSPRRLATSQTLGKCLKNREAAKTSRAVGLARAVAGLTASIERGEPIILDNTWRLSPDYSGTLDRTPIIRPPLELCRSVDALEL